MPIASFLKAADDKIRLRSALTRGTRFCALLAFSGAGVLIAFGRETLHQWVGFVDDTGYFVAVIMAVGWMGFWVFATTQAMLVGMRILWPMTWIHVFRAVSTIVLGVLMSYYWGVLGLAAGLVLPLFLSACTAVPYLACKYMQVRFKHLLKECLPAPLFIGVVVTLAGCAIQYVWPITSILVLGIQGVVILSVFGILAIWQGVDGASRRIILGKFGADRWGQQQ